MFKSTVGRIALKLLLVFLTISIYFYFQHPVVYRSTNLRAVVPIGDMNMVIDDIYITDLDEDKISGPYFRGKIPWTYRKILESDLTMELRVNLIKIATFYTRLPRTSERANLQVAGTLLYPPGVRNSINTDGQEILSRFDVRITPGICTGKGCNRTDGDNYCGWHRSGTFDLNDLDKQLTLTITDEATGKVSYIYFTPQWKKERLVHGTRFKLDADPVDTVRHNIDQLSRNNTRNALKYIAPELRDSFKPQLNSKFKGADIRYTVEWSDYLTNYNGAYRVIAEAGRFLDENRTNFVAATADKIVFYVAKARDSKFYIVRQEDVPAAD